MLSCLDVDYREETTVTACLGFASWMANTAEFETTHESGKAREYQPGEFYLRELPCLLTAIRAQADLPSLIIVDGYVWLGPNKKGLGAYLFEALDGAIPVVGVAKNRFHSATNAVEVRRGQSQRPLYVTAAGTSVSEAAEGVQAMAGDHRIPSMLKRVDRLCRDS